MNNVRARAIRCTEAWLVEVPSLGVRVRTQTLQDVDQRIEECLLRQNQTGCKERVTVRITHYLHVDDLPTQVGGRSSTASTPTDPALVAERV